MCAFAHVRTVAMHTIQKPRCFADRITVVALVAAPNLSGRRYPGNFMSVVRTAGVPLQQMTLGVALFLVLASLVVFISTLKLRAAP